MDKYFDNPIKLNTARNCLRYIIKSYDIREIYLPFYTCPVIWQTVKQEKCDIKFYHIDENFMPIYTFKDNDFIVYTNYFGICAKNVKALAKKYKNLIVDNAQAFYMPKYGLASFNSVRKFFGNTDGALLYCDRTMDIKIEQDNSEERNAKLMQKKLSVKEQNYSDFLNVDETLVDEPLKTMSDFTMRFLNSIDTEAEKQKRLDNFRLLDESLSELNKLKIVLDSDDVPMYYPFLFNGSTRQILKRNGIQLEQFWSPINSKSQEAYFQKYLLPLPIDGRFSALDMLYISELIKTTFSRI